MGAFFEVTRSLDHRLKWLMNETSRWFDNMKRFHRLLPKIALSLQSFFFFWNFSKAENIIGGRFHKVQYDLENEENDKFLCESSVSTLFTKQWKVRKVCRIGSLDPIKNNSSTFAWTMDLRNYCVAWNRKRRNIFT